MNDEDKVRCEHTLQNWSYKNETGELVRFEAVLTGKINLVTNEIFISDHLEVKKDSEKDELNEFAIQHIHEVMSENLERQLRD
jgi:hypothetical protein